MMPLEGNSMLGLFGIFIVLMLIAGTYCLLATFNLIRALIGIEILMKAVTLSIILAGYVTGHMAQAQAMVITLIVIEVVVMVVAGGVVLNVFRHNKNIDARNLRNCKG